jgi:hypothetical protein
MSASNGAYARRLLLGAVLAAGFFAGGARGATQPTTTVALLLSISGRPQGVVPVPVSEIRAEVCNQFSATLSQRGFQVVSQETMLNLRREWRVRDGRVIPPGFLDVLADSLEVDLVMVADLVVLRNRVLMTARYVDTASRVMRGVSVTEWDIQPQKDGSGAEWLSAAGKASAAAAAARLQEMDPARRRALIFEARAVGCPASVALIASHVLYAYYLEHGDRLLIDPAATNATLIAAGHSPRQLGADARARLRATYDCRGLLIPQLISYAPKRRSPAQIAQYDELTNQQEPVITDFALSLRLVDLNTGAITVGKEVFLAVPEPTGWFGVPRDNTLMKRFNITAGHLWSYINNALEEF